MNHYYTDERNAQIVIAVLKAYGIHRVVASPGSSTIAFLGSVQFDPWFQIYSAIDERHAAYMACGIAAESGAPVVLNCTGSTASRNYLPALTEAYYRRLPILAITSAHPSSHAGNLYPQYVDRSVAPHDTVAYSINCPIGCTGSQLKEIELNVIRAVLELTRPNARPVHINLETGHSSAFNTKTLPRVRIIQRHYNMDDAPELPNGKRIAVVIGCHHRFETDCFMRLEHFLKSRNAVALCDAASNYYGENRINSALVCAQKGVDSNPLFAGLRPELIIHIGDISNDYATNRYLTGIAPVWRVSSDGSIADRYGRLEHVFAVDEKTFFTHYCGASDIHVSSYYDAWTDADRRVRKKMVDLPFSNLWIASQIVPRLDATSMLHLGVSSTLQCWNAYLHKTRIETATNVGCCGIDGCVSTFIGASLVHPEKKYYGVFGDLTFFYDLNALGNRHIGRNVRILLINNGEGALFHHPGHSLDVFGEDRSRFFSAAGHFGARSRNLVKHYATDLGFKYLSASTKAEFQLAMVEFLTAESDFPILFECFTKVQDEREAWRLRVSCDTYQRTPSARELMGMLLPSNVKSAIHELTRNY